jgi:hypothetical protein
VVSSISKFEGEFEFLSNFSPHAVTIEGMTFPTAEHAFQALKTLNMDERKMIRERKTPGQAKRAGQKVTLRPNWDKIRVTMMSEVVAKKLLQNHDILELLLKTKGRELIEGNNWGDTFWGVCDGVGENQLGKILMFFRDDILNTRRVCLGKEEI